MKAKLAGTTGMPFEVIGVSRHAYEELTGKEATPFIQYYADKEGNFPIQQFIARCRKLR